MSSYRCIDLNCSGTCFSDIIVADRLESHLPPLDNLALDCTLMKRLYTALSWSTETLVIWKKRFLKWMMTKWKKHLLAASIWFPTVKLIRSVGTIADVVAEFLSTNACTIIAFKLILLTNDRCAEFSTLVGWVSAIGDAIADFTGFNRASIQTGEVTCENFLSERLQQKKKKHFEHDCAKILSTWDTCDPHLYTKFDEIEFFSKLIGFFSLLQWTIGN